MSSITMQIIYLKCYNIVKTKKNLLQPSRVEHNQSPPVELSKVGCNFALLLRAPNICKCPIFSCPGRMFSYCVRARAYTHVLARVYSTRASTCTIYTCFTLPPTRVNPTGLQLSIFQQFWSFVTNIRTSMLPNKFYGRAQPN